MASVSSELSGNSLTSSTYPPSEVDEKDKDLTLFIDDDQVDARDLEHSTGFGDHVVPLHGSQEGLGHMSGVFAQEKQSAPPRGDMEMTECNEDSASGDNSIENHGTYDKSKSSHLPAQNEQGDEDIASDGTWDRSSNGVDTVDETDQLSAAFSAAEISDKPPHIAVADNNGAESEDTVDLRDDDRSLSTVPSTQQMPRKPLHRLHSNRSLLLEELFTNVCDLQDIMHGSDQNPTASSRRQKSGMIQKTTTMNRVESLASLRPADLRMENAADKVFRSHSLAKGGGTKSSVKSVECDHMSNTSVQSSDAGNAQYSFAAEENALPSDGKLHVRLADKLMQLSCALCDWDDVLHNADDFISATIENPSSFVPHYQDVNEVVGQANALKVLISTFESMLKHSAYLLKNLFDKLKAFLLNYPLTEAPTTPGDDFEDLDLDDRAFIVDRLMQVEKQVEVLTKLVVLLSGFCTRPEISGTQHEEYEIAYVTLVELLHMTVSSLHKNYPPRAYQAGYEKVGRNADALLSATKWKISDNLLPYWQAAGHWQYLRRLARKQDQNAADRIEPKEHNPYATNADSKAFDVSLVEHIAFLVLKKALAPKLNLVYDGRRTEIPLGNCIKASLSDLHILCGWPADFEEMVPIPLGALSLLSRLKIPSIERDEISRKLLPALLDDSDDAGSKCLDGEGAATENKLESSVVILYSATDELSEQQIIEDITSGDDGDFSQKSSHERGATGVGKSTLAATTISRDSIRRKFNGGMAWVELRKGGKQEESGNNSSLTYISYCNYLQSICLQLDESLVSDVPEFCRFVPQPDDEANTRVIKERQKMRNAKEQMERYLQKRNIHSSRRGEKILLILDNLFDPGDMQWFQFRPKNSPEQVHILATTQNRAFRNAHRNAIEVGVMLHDEALQLLMAESRYSGETSDVDLSAAKKITSACRCHPLLVMAAGRWLRTMKQSGNVLSTFSDVANSLSAMHDKNTPLLFQVFNATLSVQANGKLSQLTKLCLAALVDVIQPSGCFDNVYLDTPVSLIKNFWKAIFQSEDCEDILDDLLPAEQNSGNDVFDLVLDTLESTGVVDLSSTTDRAKDSAHITFISYKNERSRLYGCYLAKGNGVLESIAEDSVCTWNKALVDQYTEIMDGTSPRSFDACEDYIICMLPTHMARGRLAVEMEQLLSDEDFIHRRLAAFGCHQGTLLHVQDCEKLRELLSEDNEKDDSEKTHRIVSVYEKVAVVLGKIMARGDDHESDSLILDVVQAMHEMGFSLFEMDCSSKAFRYYKTSREILKYNKECEHGRHELLAACKYSIGLIHMKADRYKKAMACLEQSLKIWEFHLGKDNEYTAQINYHMGTIHARYGYYRKALACYEHALSIRRGNEDSAGIARTLAKIGHVYHKSGELDEALQCYTEALEVNDKTSGKCLELSVTWNRIGNIHTIKGEYEEAMQCFMKSLELRGLTLDDSDLDVADTLQNIAILCHFKGEFDDALQCFNQAMAVYREKLGETHFKIGDSLYNLGSLYVDMNDYENAQQALEKALRIRKLSLHADHVDVADTLHLLGLVLVNLSDRQNALPCFREALRIRKHMLGSGNPLVADSMNTLGVFYKEMNVYDKAVEYILKELKLRKKQLGNESMRVAETYHFLGTLEIARDNQEESINYFEESLKLKRSLVEPDNPSVAETLGECACVYAEIGNYTRATSLVEECLRIRELNPEENKALLGDTLHLMGKIHAQFERYDDALRSFEQALVKRQNDDLASAQTLHTIGCVYDEMDQEDRALDMFEQAVKLKKRTLGEDHEDLAEDYGKIGNIFAHQCLYDDSMARFDEYIRISELETSTKWEIETFLLEKADILHKMAVIHNMKGCFDAALECELNALHVYQSKLGDNDIRVADSLHNVGCFLSVAGKCEESLEYFEDAYRLRKSLLGRNHEDVATTLYNAASSQNMMGNYTKALKCLKEALEIRQNTLGEHHEKVTATLQRIAAVCREMGDFSEAVRTYEEILPALIEQVGNKDLRVAAVLHALGNLEDDQGNYEGAMRYFEDALKIRKLCLGDNHEDVASCLSSIAFVKSNMGDEQGALDYLNEALQIRKERLGEDHELVSDTHNNLAYFCCSLGKREDARFHLWEALRIRKQSGAHQKVADTLNNLGNVHKDMGEYDLAIECYQEALRVRERSQIEGIGDTYFNLGDLFVLKGDLDSATECYEESLKIRTTKLGKDHLKVADGHLNMVDVHLKRKEYNMALLRLEEVLRIKRLNLGNDTEDVANTLYSMGIVHNAMRDSRTAYQKFEEALAVFLAAGCSQDHPQVAALSKMLRPRQRPSDGNMFGWSLSSRRMAGSTG